MVKKVREWVIGFNTLVGVAQKQSKAAYVFLHNTLQQECSFVQHSIQVLGGDFRPVEKSLWEEFLLAHIMVQTITVFQVKHVGIAIPYPTLISQGDWNALCAFAKHLAAALRGCVKFRSGYHAQLLTNGHMEIQFHKAHEAWEALLTDAEGISPTEG